MERFKYKTEELLNHSRNPECLGRAKVLMFDGKQDDSNWVLSIIEISGIPFVQLSGSLFIFIIVSFISDEGKGEESTPSRVLFKGVRGAIEETMLKPLV